jgi:hypothetical protein
MITRRHFCQLLGAVTATAALGRYTSAEDSVALAKPPEIDFRVTRARKVYSDGRHNAFTGMARFNGRVYLCFRSSEDHVAPGGGIRVIASNDLNEWETAHFVSEPTRDYRDPKLVNFGGELRTYFAAVPFRDGRPDSARRASMVVRSKGGQQFGKPELLTGLPKGVWLWHVATQGDTLYGTGYSRAENGQYLGTLFRSKDGIAWERHADIPSPGSETFLDFDKNGTLWLLVRRQDQGNVLVLCRAEAPYDSLTVERKMPMPLGGPFVKRLDYGWIIITRQWDPPGRRNLRTEIFWLGDQAEQPRSITRLPSGGDTSYAAWLDTSPGQAVVSYYSSHEHKIDEAVQDDHLFKKDAAHAEHTTAADIFLADVSWGFK